MADSSLIVTVLGAGLKAAGYVVVGVLGWAGRGWQSRSKKQLMRKHLYKEISLNYSLLADELESQYSNLGKGKPLKFAFEYYRYAKQSLDVFHDLPESQVILLFYNHLEAATTAEPLTAPGPAGYVMWAYGLVHDAADDGRLDAKLLLKQSTPYIRKLLEKHIAEVHAERAEATLEFYKRTRREAIEKVRSKHLPPSAEESK